MTATYQEAYDSVLTLFKAAWDITGWVVVYQNTPNEGKPKETEPWARVSMSLSSGRQASLSGGLGTARYERNGVVVVQIFTPAGEGLSKAHSLAKIVTDTYEGSTTPNGVWFRNVRVNEVGIDDNGWFQTNVIVEFNYDEIK